MQSPRHLMQASLCFFYELKRATPRNILPAATPPLTQPRVAMSDCCDAERQAGRGARCSGSATNRACCRCGIGWGATTRAQRPSLQRAEANGTGFCQAGPTSKQHLAPRFSSIPASVCARRGPTGSEQKLGAGNVARAPDIKHIDASSKCSSQLQRRSNFRS
jgi:hypothetical protein